MFPAADRFRTMRAGLLAAVIPCLLAFLAPGIALEAVTSSTDSASPQALASIQQYISEGWGQLTRTMTECKSVEDSKTTARSVLYLPADLDIPVAVRELQERCRVRVEHLPQRITKLGEVDLSKIPAQGLLYLAHPYVVPGGQFNEMYGWDSYFIIRGLLRDRRTSLAKGMVENFFFEIDHYGGVLNANRTYYLTRSQPPFLSSMVLAIYDAEETQGKQDRAWIEEGYRHALRDYELWNEGAHRAGDTGLARYYDFGDGPVPEILNDPSHYYRGVASYLLVHRGDADDGLIGSGNEPSSAEIAGSHFKVTVCDSAATQAGGSDCAPSLQVMLSPDFYKGDRAMRESGFDVTFRFGPYGAATHHFAPVCLNSLLYKTEKDLERMSLLLGRTNDAAEWQRKAAERQARIVKYMWDPGTGEFFDYDFRNSRRSTYEYAATFYPLWAGLATADQARAVAANLKRFEQAGGLATSRVETGAQWDYPYGWAPLQLLATEGLRRYGFIAEADRISAEFLSTVLASFNRDHTIREKYNVVTRSSDVNVNKGYARNEIGFGWTNGVFLELLHESSRAASALENLPN